MSHDTGLAVANVAILDGGTGSELRRRGIRLSPACWSAEANLNHVEVLTGIHRDYIAAGASLITANTFANTRFVLADAGLDKQFETINRNALRAAREAAAASDRHIVVAASISCLPPSFDRRRYPTPEEEYLAYVELAELHAADGADVLLLEMLQDAQHGTRVCRAARQAGLPFWAGISCRLAEGAAHDADRGHGPGPAALTGFDDPGTPFDDVLDAILPFEPAGIAVMHSPVEAILPALERVRARYHGALGAYAEIPYREDPEYSGGETVPPDAYAQRAVEWIEAGAVLVGGCCGTTPKHIAAIRARLGR